VTNADGFWIGDNTDVHGVRAALASAGFDPAGKKIVILGKGGGAKAAAAAVKNAGEILMLSREEVANAGQHSCDLLVNATPVGMYPNTERSPIEGPIAAGIVFDMVYNPATTRLLRQAADQGKTIIQGEKMFLAQAARQFEIWTGQAAPTEIYQTGFNGS
jgi:shikimate dehydrogenase